MDDIEAAQYAPMRGLNQSEPLFDFNPSWTMRIRVLLDKTDSW